jgi:hypothetical protein
LQDEGVWVIYQNRETESFHLCFTETDDLSEPLPEGLALNACDLFGRPPSVSPDGKRVVFTDCSYTNYSLYSYNIETGQLNNLGMGGEAESIHVMHWLDNETFTVSSSVNRNDEIRYVYLANAAQSDSMELIASQWVYQPQYFDDPSRYIWLSDAQVHEYNLETHEERVLSQVPCNYASCSQIAIPNSQHPSLIAVLDGHPMVETKRLYIIDVDTGLIMFTTTFAGGFGLREQSSTFRWLDDDTFILFEILFRTTVFPYSARLVTLNGEQVDETIIHYLYQPSLSPNKQYLLLDDVALGIDLYELGRGSLPIIQPLDAEIYDLDLIWQEDNSLLVTFTDIQDEVTLGRWLVRVV